MRKAVTGVFDSCTDSPTGVSASSSSTLTNIFFLPPLITLILSILITFYSSLTTFSSLSPIIFSLSPPLITFTYIFLYLSLYYI